MKRLFTIVIAAAVVSTAALAQDVKRDIKSGSVEQRLDSIAAIQPGLGTIMMEYGNRFISTHFAAQAGNWGLAAYQLKEAREIQEVGEITRPKHKKQLKKFENAYLVPLEKAIKAEDQSLFNKRFAKALAGCNECHALTRHPYIQVVVPDKPLETNLNFYAVKELSSD